MDNDPAWYPRKKTGARPGPAKALTGTQRNNVAQCAMAHKQRGGLEPTYKVILAKCPAAVRNPQTQRRSVGEARAQAAPRRQSKNTHLRMPIEHMCFRFPGSGPRRLHSNAALVRLGTSGARECKRIRPPADRVRFGSEPLRLPNAHERKRVRSTGVGFRCGPDPLRRSKRHECKRIRSAATGFRCGSDPRGCRIRRCCKQI